LKKQITALFTEALVCLRAQGTIPQDAPAVVQLERTRDSQFGDFACNLAMVLAKPARCKPRDLAASLVAHLPASPLVAKVDIAGLGFINVYLAPQAYHSVVSQILAQGDGYGRCERETASRVQVEFVSANPTGPLHVGHGRGAAYGAALANLLEIAGWQVFREYYVNDAGRQMNILAACVWLRYLDLGGETLPFPARGYQGDYVWDIAADLRRTQGNAYHHAAAAVLAELPPDEPQGGDKEKHMDALVERCQALLGTDGFRAVFDAGLDAILDNIRQDLRQFGVEYDHWYSERGLVEQGKVEHALAKLRATGHLYEQDGALWFRSQAFGDEKDRVVVRENGQYTYFASDIAYHLDKLERGFDKLINIWGADHHGYVPRLSAAIAALDGDAHRLTVLLVQFATLYRGEERLQMSTRSGEFITLRELYEETGVDAARFFYVMRKNEQHLDFDLELAKSQSNDNPVYYIQYAHARICSVAKQLADRGWTWHHRAEALASLANAHEQALLTQLAYYPEMIEAAAAAYEPHQVAYYLRDLAHAFHTYYNAHLFLVDEADVRDARLSLIFAARQVLRNGLRILGASAPEVM